MCLLYTISKRKRSKKKSASAKRSNTKKLMLFKEIGTGWKTTFINRIEHLVNAIACNNVISARAHGMLRITFTAVDPSYQYILDAVSYKIERESATICEDCGEWGSRKTELLKEKMCLCWKCYALKVDALSNTNIKSKED